MNSLQAQYEQEMTTNAGIKLPSVAKAIMWLLLAAIALTMALLWFTPWVQTAYGEGQVDTINPNERIQAISALVPGQVQHWHVSEGDTVKAGDPIVTLIDTDPALLERLQNQINAARLERAATTQAIATEENNLKRQRALQKEGLTSERQIEQLSVNIQSLKATIAKVDAELNRLQVELARQSLQTKVAPTDGTILRLLSAGEATFVQPGDIVASFIPDGVDRSVVLSVDGLDAALVHKGRKVRLQFEGWPILQFSGWPEAATGTFGGIVEFIEPIADQQGRFRVWINPDPNDHAWPSTNFARLGSRVRGWILLEEVQLGYELWRQLNNFPPVPPSEPK
jgi:multidrug efflux pump subunit AcrA (membrane-fusion protein)